MLYLVIILTLQLEVKKIGMLSRFLQKELSSEASAVCGN